MRPLMLASSPQSSGVAIRALATHWFWSSLRPGFGSTCGRLLSTSRRSASVSRLASSLTHKVSCRSEFYAATDLVLNLDQPLKDLQRLVILFAIEGGQHPRVIVDGGHRRP